ncbi:gliding motility lipoprotein GldH [Cardinium endosymbiont of Tipula unca]|uniref:gliding motility lipoprotein GldH n=1 Tax=Cardinium endosymbiont of Tipula unca TaxID=3066216 RepID=UPI0030CAD8DF
MKKKQFLVWLIAFFIFGCEDDHLIQKVFEFPRNAWDVEKKTFCEFNIVSPDQPYDLVLLVNSNAIYPYQNLYIRYCLEGEEVSESAMIELQLFDKKTGKPLGYGWGDTKLYQFSLLSNYIFKKTGVYRFQLEHVMRQKVLLGIERVVFRIKPTKLNKNQ